MNGRRILTREVAIGAVPLGGAHPIRIQSMTTTDTMDTIGTVEQTLRMVQAGCEYVRITAPSIRHAENLQNIKDELKKRGCTVPLIADIHFTPNAAETAARIVEKVRVNPGNYVDKKKFDQIDYTDQEYQAELQRIYERFSPLVKICKEYGTAMRIGTNHGSLSDRIMSRYGDTPQGMVESAMEFVRICEDHNYDQIVLSMKASNTQVMVFAYRLLMSEMQKRGRVYPVHLGVTEAGEGEDGRLKSAVGIGTLLLDGIGDTVRVSLTEDPEFEPPVARYIVDVAAPAAKVAVSSQLSFQRRASTASGLIGGGQVPVVLSEHAKADVRTAAGAVVLTLSTAADMHAVRHSIKDMDVRQDLRPVIVDVRGLTAHNGKDIQPAAASQLTWATCLGPLLIDGRIDGVWVNNHEDHVLSMLSLFQAARLRTVKTEYISCPSCGRTLFDLQTTTARVRSQTSQFKGLKIAVMGCIVNGPGEMADADYGYVGSGPGKITLYRGKDIVEKNIPSENAVERLVDLIRADGRWTQSV